ncbi:MAG: hypothetical protein WCH46_04545 [bacterium]
MENPKSSMKGFAFAISFFALFAFTSLVSAQTWTGATPCYSLTVTTTAACGVNCTGGNCNGGACDHCVTFTITNNSNCWITELTIGTSNQVCFSICCPWVFGTPVENTCDPNVYTGPPGLTGHYKHFVGGTGLAPNGGSASFSICYCGAGPQSFVIFDESTTDACCTYVVGTPPSNYFTYSF